MSCMCSELCSARHAIVLSESVCLVCRWSPVWGVGIIIIKMFLNKYESIMMLPPVEKCISCCLSHQNPVTYLFRAVLAFKQCLICADFSPDSHQNTFHWRKRYGLWTHIYLKTSQWWICLIFCLLKMLTDGLEWCDLLWCFYQLFGLSFWRHPFTIMYPLLSEWCNAKFLQIWWRYKLIYIL